VVVREDHRSGGGQDGRPENFARMNDGCIEAPDRHRLDAENGVTGREEHGEEVLALRVLERWRDELRDVLGARESRWLLSPIARVRSSATYMGCFLLVAEREKTGLRGFPESPADGVERTENGRRSLPPPRLAVGEVLALRTLPGRIREEQPDRIASATDSISRAVQARSQSCEKRAGVPVAVPSSSGARRCEAVGLHGREESNERIGGELEMPFERPRVEVPGGGLEFHERAVLLHEVDHPRRRMSSTSPVSGSRGRSRTGLR